MGTISPHHIPVIMAIGARDYARMLSRVSAHRHCWRAEINGWRYVERGNDAGNCQMIEER